MRRLLRLPELVELATHPEVIEKMLAELGGERSLEILRLLKAEGGGGELPPGRARPQRRNLTARSSVW